MNFEIQQSHVREIYVHDQETAVRRVNLALLVATEAANCGECPAHSHF